MSINPKILAWSMIVVLFTHFFGISAFYGLYDLDKDIFIELFCINKDKPELECDGSCMIAKIKEQRKKSQQKPALPDFSQFQLTYVIQDTDLTVTQTEGIESNEVNPTTQNFSCSGYLNEILRPPILA